MNLIIRYIKYLHRQYRYNKAHKSDRLWSAKPRPTLGFFQWVREEKLQSFYIAAAKSSKQKSRYFFSSGNKHWRCVMSEAQIQHDRKYGRSATQEMIDKPIYKLLFTKID
jgi:hypothetical protein